MGKNKIFYHILLTSLFFLISFSCIFISKKAYHLDNEDRYNQLDKKYRTSSGKISWGKINSPTKVHYYNGSMVLFENGFEMTRDSIIGNGLHYNLTRKKSKPVEKISRDSIAFMEYYKKEIQSGPFLGGIAAPLLFFLAIQNEDIHKYFFGSCPTVYSLDKGMYHLQAECFSYSISPYLETYDLDCIKNRSTINGQFILNVRNEAAETHYINQMKLLIVEHPEGYEPFSKNLPFLDQKNQIILFGNAGNVDKIISKSGKNVQDLLSKRDEQWYRSDPIKIQSHSENIEKDWIELTARVPDDAKNLYVALRYRNTLFHTVQFYDLVLSESGAQAIDWIGVNLADLFYRAQLYRWYQQYFGIQVDQWNGLSFEEITHIDDTGPIAWKEIAFKLPVPDDNYAKLRFNFLADNIMLDWIGISYDTSTDYTISEAECSEILDLNGRQNNLSASILDSSDDQYLITYPADSYKLLFNVKDKPVEKNRTYFLSSSGYYIEWVRNEWMKSAENSAERFEFELDESSIIRAVKIWASKKAEFEKKFFNSKIQSNGDIDP